MALQTIPRVADAASILGNPTALTRAVKELQGLNVTVIDGAAAGTKMNVPALRTEDTIISAIQLNDTWAAPVDDKANITIQSTKASATITISGNPVADETVTVNGVVYTWKATPTSNRHVKITSGNNTQMGADLAAVINAYESRYEAGLTGDGNRIARISASAASGVVTITSVADGVGNAPQVTGTVTVLAATNSNTGQATLTCASVVNNNTCVVNGVTFTAKTTVTDTDLHFALKGTDALQAIEIARCINAYQFKYGSLDVLATPVGAAVNITPKSDPTGNAIALSEASTNVAVSGSYLSGGTATGGIKSTTNLSTATLVLVWFDKNP